MSTSSLNRRLLVLEDANYSSNQTRLRCSASVGGAPVAAHHDLFARLLLRHQRHQQHQQQVQALPPAAARLRIPFIMAATSGSTPCSELARVNVERSECQTSNYESALMIWPPCSSSPLPPCSSLFPACLLSATASILISLLSLPPPLRTYVIAMTQAIGSETCCKNSSSFSYSKYLDAWTLDGLLIRV